MATKPIDMPASDHSEGKKTRAHSISFMGSDNAPADSQTIKSPSAYFASLLSLGSPRATSASASAHHWQGDASPPLSTASGSSLQSSQGPLTPPGTSPKSSGGLKVTFKDDDDGVQGDLKNFGFPLGRRSTWTPSSVNHPATVPDSYSVSSWLKSVQSPPSTQADATASFGLFRRLSLGTGTTKPAVKDTHPKITSAALPGSAVDDSEDRLGRDLSRQPAVKRKLSPLASKMLTGQFY